MINYLLAEKTRAILGSAIEVHRALGPGLLESTYRVCLVKQLSVDGMKVDEEVAIPINYRGCQLDAAYRADVIVDQAVLLELKAIDGLLPIHEAQVLTYLKHTNLQVGLLINFNVHRLMSGVRRLVRTSPNASPIAPASPAAHPS
jgi:GxxExxY protein